VQIRPSEQKDFDELLGLFRQLWPSKAINENVLQCLFEKALSSRGRFCFSAMNNGSVIGFVSLSINDSFWQEGLIGHIDELVVDVSHRKQCIGTLLLNHVISVAQKHSCRRIELDSGFHRENAHRLYQYLGFEKRAFLFSKALQ